MFKLMMFAIVLMLSLPVLAQQAGAEDAAPTTAPQPATEAKTAFDTLINAIEANDFEKLATVGDTAFKAALTKPVFDQLHDQLAPRMKQGYETTYLGELKQQGYKVSLWKMAFTDEGDDLLIKLVMKDGKVGGFFLI